MLLPTRDWQQTFRRLFEEELEYPNTPFLTMRADRLRVRAVSLAPSTPSSHTSAFCGMKVFHVMISLYVHPNQDGEPPCPLLLVELSKAEFLRCFTHIPQKSIAAEFLRCFTRIPFQVYAYTWTDLLESVFTETEVCSGSFENMCICDFRLGPSAL